MDIFQLMDFAVEQELDGLQITKVDLVKFSLDIKRPRVLYGSCMHPEVMKQLAEKYDLFHAVIPMIEKFGMKIAIENHTDTFALLAA